jgi:hypothetical protein
MIFVLHNEDFKKTVAFAKNNLNDHVKIEKMSRVCNMRGRREDGI